MQVSRPNIFEEKKRLTSRLWLDKNENINLNLFKFIKKNTILTKEVLSSYPNLSTTYKKISRYYKISKYSILLSNGSDGVIQNVFQTLIKKNSKVILPKPTFAMYDVYSKAFDANIFYLNYKLNSQGKIIFDLKKLFKLLKKKPKLLCLPNPDSPSGTIIEKKILKKILYECKKINCYVLIDEAYHLFYKSSQTKNIKYFPNLLIAKSFSKAFGLAGIRAGCLIANSKTILYFKSFKQMYEISHYAAEVLNTIFTKKGLSIIKKSINELKKGKIYFINNLKKLNLKYLLSYGNFIHVNLGKNKKKIIKELKKICYFRENDTLLPVEGYSRFTLTNKKNFEKILNVIKRSF